MKFQVSYIKRKQTISLIIAVVIIALIIVNSLLFYTRIDLTKNKAYSISNVSRDIVRALPDTVYIDYYVSPKLKTATLEPQQMIDLLQEYQARSTGTVIFAEKDPDNPQYSSMVEQHQLQAQQIQVVEQNQATYAVVYSGIVLTYQDQNRVIPFFLQPAVLEYQITSKIQEMINNDKRVVGILTLDSFYEKPQSLQSLRQVLENDYQVKSVSAGVSVENDIDALFVIGAQSIDNNTAYYIDQFLMEGKGVYFATDTVRVSIDQGLFANKQHTVLHDMIEHYGIKIEDTIVLDKYNKMIPVNQGRGLQMLQNYPMWITIADEHVNSDNPITARFGGLDLYWTSPLTSSEDKKQYITPLFSSSKDSWTKSHTPMPESGYNTKDLSKRPKVYKLQPDATGFIVDKTEENTKSYAVTDAFIGPLASAVEAGIIEIPEGAKDSYKAKTDTARFIVTGSSLFTSFMTRVSGAQYNLVYLSNSSDWLGSDEKLLQIKSRAVKDMRLNKIQDPVKKNAMALVVQLWNIIVIPLIIIVTAFVVLIVRYKSSKRKYIDSFSLKS